jgi:UPF0716 protein FxsA
MGLILLIIFIVIPVAEIYVLIEVGGIIGAVPTVFMVVFTAVLGALLLRQQGFYTLRKVQEDMQKGILPAVALVEGLILLVGGAMLLTPGFITDFIGFMMLVPPLRRAVAVHLINSQLFPHGRGPGPGPMGGSSSGPGERKTHKPNIIEGEFHRDDD